jgi:hypothetical protein
LPDWINSFVEATTTIRAPEEFRRWAAIAAIAGTLERRVWTVTDVSKLYPNFYIILAGEPASGKTNSAREARKTLTSITGLHLGPDNPTKASFLDQLAAADRVNGHNVFHAMTVVCEEFGVFLKTKDDDLISDLTTLFDNPENYSSPRRSSTSVNVQQPTVNILACATPAVLGKFPESAWNEGFTSRVIFIYGVRPTDSRNAFKKRIDLDLTDLKAEAQTFFVDLHGEFEWDQEAQEAYNTWYNTGMHPKPDYGRLEHYIGRRDTHVMKLSMISAVSAGHGLNVTLSDFNRARLWLLEAEIQMPNVFIAMTTPSDSKVLEDLYLAVRVEHDKIEREKRKPVHNEFLYSFLSHRVTSEKIDRLILTAERTGLLRKAGFGWIPNPRPNGELK